MDDVTFAARRATSGSPRNEPPDLESRFKSLVQSPLRAGILRFLSARPDETFDSETLMQTFGRMRQDVDNCVAELVEFGVVKKHAGDPPSYGGIKPEQRAGRQAARRLPRRPRQPRHRRSVAVGAALPRDDRPRREDAGHLRVDPHRGEVRHLGPDPRTDRRRQGSRGAHDPRAVAPRPGKLPGRQLRGAARQPVRVGNLRLRKRRLHRRARSQARTARARQRRHAVPRRGRRHVADGAGQTAARARGTPLRAPRRQSSRSTSTSG